MNNSPMPPRVSRLFSIPDYTIRYLRAGDEALIFSLLERCMEFSLLVSGQPPTPEEAAGLLTDLPPGKTLADKFAIGLFAGPQRLVGLVDLIRGYPQPEDWFIGLMQLDPAYRGKGLGRQLYQAVEGWSATQGAKDIQLGVVEQNAEGFAFWEKLGFAVIARRPPAKFGLIESAVFLMKKEIN